MNTRPSLVGAGGALLVVPLLCSLLLAIPWIAHATETIQNVFLSSDGTFHLLGAPLVT